MTYCYFARRVALELGILGILDRRIRPSEVSAEKEKIGDRRQSSFFPPGCR